MYIFRLLSVSCLSCFVGLSAWSENYSCQLNFGSDGREAGELLIREGTFATEAVYISNTFGATNYTCIESIIDAYECYGFAKPPGETPLQLNIIGREVGPGTKVAMVALNKLFLSKFLFDDKVEPVDFTTRRFSVDMYDIADCK